MKKLMMAVLVLLPIFQGAQAATVTNGQFMAGLTGWTTQGNVSVNGAGNAVLTSSFSGTSTSVYGGVNGSILTQAINAAAGDLISFEFNFLAGDYMPYNDFAVVVGDSMRLLSNIATVGDYGSTGWRSFSFVAGSSFSNLSFVLSNALDSGYDSTLLIDNVRVSNTPIPAAAWLFGSAMVGMMGLGRKKRVAA